MVGQYFTEIAKNFEQETGNKMTGNDRRVSVSKGFYEYLDGLRVSRIE